MQPTVVDRPEQPYLSITVSVPMRELGERVPPLNGEVFGWLAARGLAPAGPPLWKYNVIDMAGELEVEAGVPVSGTPSGDDRVQLHVLPAGRYAVAHHVGHPATLEAATADLLAWASARDLHWDVTDDGGRERWTARYEEYLTDPAEQPDLDQWETNLVFKLAD